MLQLPNSKNLPIGILAGCFGNTVATYKFYWFLSLIEAVENGKTTIDKKEIFIKMIANAWYTINYFKVSFGKTDKFEDVIKTIKEIENLDIDLERNAIEKRLLNSSLNETEKLLKHFDKNVPHWFLSRWFPSKTEKEIYELSQQFDNQCLYALHKDKIEINPDWINYLKQNSGILKAFCFWHLSLFLQVRNPNVPDIPNKLIKSAKRGSLNNQRKHFWNIVFEELNEIECIYTGNKLTIDKYAVEHFIPYSFVSHDLIWNLIPADTSFNSSKSNKLPQLKKHFDGFYKLQEIGFEIVKKHPSSKLIFEDYLMLFPNQIWDKTRLEDTIQPLITIAHNNGFEYL
jgi:HNH endonuclease